MRAYVRHRQRWYRYCWNKLEVWRRMAAPSELQILKRGLRCVSTASFCSLFGGAKVRRDGALPILVPRRGAKLFVMPWKMCESSRWTYQRV